MFFKLVVRNSKRDRKSNGLYFSSMIISIIAFYIILSLSHQDIMIFLKKMESDAVDRLFTLIPIFYISTLVILFFWYILQVVCRWKEESMSLGCISHWECVETSSF